MSINHNQKGFTLLEILVALTLITLLSVMMLSNLSPFLSFKQKLDNDRKLMEIKSVFSTIYERNAWAVETNPGAIFTFAGGALSTSALTPTNACVSQSAALAPVSQYFSDGLPTGATDGYGNDFCILVSPQLSQVLNGNTIYYHNIAVVSMGRDSALDGGTGINPATGALGLAGDDVGVLVNGFTIQAKKFQQTSEKLEVIARAYEQYFTTRFLANPTRDVYNDYFASGNPTGNWDPTAGASIGGTSGVFKDVYAVLAPLGISQDGARSAWESNNTIYLGNYNESVSTGGATVSVRSSAGGVTPPYTAVMYAPLPGPAGTNLIKVVTGNY